MLKVVLHDFDGTLVTKDILDVACGIMGKEAESRKINEEFHLGLRPGIETLVERINFLKGITLDQVSDELDKNSYLMPGAQEWIKFLKENNIVVILHSGNIEPILKYYQDLLKIDYIIGTKPKIEDETIQGIEETNVPKPNFKVERIDLILKKLGISPEDTLAIGDSIADKKVFEYAGSSIAINPKGGVEKYATYTIEDDLSLAIALTKKEMQNIEGSKRVTGSS